MAAAEAEARKNNWNVSIAILDEGGRLLMLQKMDGAPPASVDVCQAKGRSAAIFKRPTKVFSELVAGGRVAIMALPGAVPVEGGVPLMSGDRLRRRGRRLGRDLGTGWTDRAAGAAVVK